jgi:hypothetical protein
MLFDSNAVIYSAKPENQSLRELIAKNAGCVPLTLKLGL